MGPQPAVTVQTASTAQETGKEDHISLHQIFSQSSPKVEYHTLASSLRHGRQAAEKGRSHGSSVLPMKVLDQPPPAASIVAT